MTSCPRCSGSGLVFTGAEARAHRNEHKLHIHTVAQRMGISSQYLSDLENDKRDWNGALLMKFLEACKRWQAEEAKV